MKNSPFVCTHTHTHTHKREREKSIHFLVNPIYNWLLKISSTYKHSCLVFHDSLYYEIHLTSRDCKDAAVNRKGSAERVGGSSKQGTKREGTSGLITSGSSYQRGMKRGRVVYLDSGRARVTGPRLRRTASRDSRNRVIGAFGCRTGCIYAHMHTPWPRFGGAGARVRARPSPRDGREEARRKIRPAFPGECVSIPSGFPNEYERTERAKWRWAPLLYPASYPLRAFHAGATGNSVWRERQRSIKCGTADDRKSFNFYKDTETVKLNRKIERSQFAGISYLTLCTG